MSNNICISSLSLAFRSTQNRPVVEQFSATLRPGLLGICGPNGAGKSSLLHYLLSQPHLVALSGKVTGLESAHFSYVGQGSVAVSSIAEWLSPVDNAALTFRLSGASWKTARQMAVATSGQLLRLIPTGRVSSRLSGGEKQIVVIARELARGTSGNGSHVLLLDEPATGLDFERRIRVMEYVRKRIDDAGMIGVIVEHNLELLALFCDEVIVGTRTPMRIHTTHSVRPNGPRGVDSLGSRWLSDATQQIQESLREAIAK